MFHDIPELISLAMSALEERDAADRIDGTPRLDRLRQIPPQTGRFLALLAASSPRGSWIEIGTSAGYSSLWLALACRERAQILTTFENLASKTTMATATFASAQVNDVITLVQGDFSTSSTNSTASASASSTPRRKSTDTATRPSFPGWSPEGCWWPTT
jgi:caffeoyl-CoA O-methyltransferase